jgi:hypothetical protein
VLVLQIHRKPAQVIDYPSEVISIIEMPLGLYGGYVNTFSDYEEDIAAKPRFRNRWPIVLMLWPRLINPRGAAIGQGKLITSSISKETQTPSKYPNQNMSFVTL